MRIRLPLIGQAMAWLICNLLLIAVLVIVAAGHGGSSWNVLLSEPVRDRLVTIADDVALKWNTAKPDARDAVLQHLGSDHQAHFSVSLPGSRPPDRSPPASGPTHGPGPAPEGAPSERRGFSPAGPPGSPPDAPRDHNRYPGQRPPEGAGGPTGPRDGEPPPPLRNRDQRLGMISIEHPSPGSFVVSVPAIVESEGGSRGVEIDAAVSGFGDLLIFLGIAHEIGFLGLIALASALLWAPFIYGLTRTIGQITEATRQISEGQFDVRVPTRRNDELGLLASSVNRMADRLNAYVRGQRQFVADIAHEVTAPLARMQMGLGILESHISEANRPRIDDLLEDAAQMSAMLGELLMFSRAALAQDTQPKEIIDIEQAVQAALLQEGGADRVRTTVPNGTRVSGHRTLLVRAIANLVRNALHYSPEDGTLIQIVVDRRSEKTDHRVHLRVSDSGPGVPPDILSRLGEPFYRPDLSRTRDTGGFGLGLTIVTRCVESCGGEVAFRNRPTGGFEAELRLVGA